MLRGVFALILISACLVPGQPILAGDAFTMEVTGGGELRLKRGTDVWSVSSAWSYAGNKIRWHRLENGSRRDDWTIKVHRDGDEAFDVEAQGAPYKLLRQVRLVHGHVDLHDHLTNTSGEDVGILLQHTIRGRGPVSDIRLCGGRAEAAIYAENPTVFLKHAASALGIVAQDDLFRSQFHALRTSDEASLGMHHLGLPAGKSVTLDWSIYPLGPNADYFDFINQLRRDWNVNYTVPGPSDWLDVTDPSTRAMILDPAKLRAFLSMTGLRVILLVPWLDYENINRLTDQPMSRDEYREAMREAIQKFRAVDPQIRLLGCVEGPFVSLPRELVSKLVALMPTPRKTGYHEMTPEMFAEFKQFPQAWNQWGDSIVWARGGKAHYEYYTRGSRQQVDMIALTARPALGNGQHVYLMDQVRFIVEDVGLDGYYIDSFTGAQHWHYGYSYDKWDGVTVDVDAATGNITDRYTDLALAGVGSRKAIIDYGLSRGKLVVVNGHPIDRETQALHAIFFNESEWVFEPLKWMDKEPPLDQRPCEAHLSSPIALGFRPSRGGDEGMKRYAEFIMKGVIAYLRHGITYFHYRTELPESGPGAGEYGPFKHMFPITPQRLGEGFIEGQERTIACVSRSFVRIGGKRPQVLIFDMHGRLVSRETPIEKTPDGWRVDLKLDDWRSIAVIE